MKTLLSLLRSTAFRLSLVYLVAFSLFAAALLAFVSWQGRALYNSQLAATLNAEVRGLAEIFRFDGIRGLVDAIERRADDPGAGIYLLTTFNGEPIAGNIAAIPRASLERVGVYRLPYVGHGGSDGAGGQRQLRSRASIVQVFHLPGGFRLVVGRDVEDQLDFEEVIRRASYFAAALVILLAVFGGSYITRRVLSRVDAMSATSRRIMDGNLSERLATDGSGDEFDRLAGSVNLMLDRINDLLHGMKEVSDNIAHDLKTPLTRLKGRAEAALRDSGDDPDALRTALGASIEEADGLIEVVGALLLIARAEAGGGEGSFATIDLAEIVADVAELYEPAAENARLDLVTDIDGPAPISGNRALIGQAIGNLLDNAITHAAPESETSDTGKGILRLSLSREDEGVCLVVADSGPGIPAAQRDHVLERFVRLEQSRSRPGSGLGLSLVSAIVRLHKGMLRLEDNAPGLRVVMRFPAQDPASESAGETGKSDS